MIFCSQRKHFVHCKTGVALRGVHNAINDALLPFHPSRLRKKLTARAYTVHDARCYGTSDRDHGAHVDQDLVCAAAVPCSSCLDNAAVEALVYARHRRQCDPCSLAILNAIRQNGWRIVCAQLPVGCVRMRVGTAIDLLCEDTTRTGELIAIEVKTSRHSDKAFYEEKLAARHIDTGNDRDAPALAVSYQHIDLMQLFITCILLQRTLNAKKLPRGALLRVGARGVVWHYRVPPTWIARFSTSVPAKLEKIEEAYKTAATGRKRKRRSTNKDGARTKRKRNRKD